MMSTRRQPGPLLLWSLMAPLMVLAFGTGLQTGAPESSVPTAIEQALIEHRCRTTVAAGAPGSDAYQQCPAVQLLSLRTDFGRDLSRLAAAERRSIDSVCSKIRASQGRDGYVDCLSAQLVSLSNRRNRTRPDSSAAAPPPEEIAPSVSPALLADPASSSSSGLWIGAVLIALGAAAGGVFLAMKTRRSARTCRACGMNVSDSGDLCQKCRHEAAEAVKHAAAERDHERAQEESLRQGSEHKETELRLKSFEEEETRLRQREQARQEEQARREAETGRREEEARRRDVASEEAVDPCSILGIPRDATQDAIRTAYQEARLKYDPDQVAHLGAELQEHFKVKAQAVEQAYQQLSK